MSPGLPTLVTLFKPLAFRKPFRLRPANLRLRNGCRNSPLLRRMLRSPGIIALLPVRQKESPILAGPRQKLFIAFEMAQAPWDPQLCTIWLKLSAPPRALVATLIPPRPL